MEKGILMTIVIVVIVLGAIAIAINLTGGFGPKGDVTPTTDINTKGIILFYGRECPHCKDVEDFIVANNIAEKVNFVQSEVWHNNSNAALLGQKVQICGITASSVGVPFLFDGNNKCYIGKPDVVDFLKAQAGLSGQGI